MTYVSEEKRALLRNTRFCVTITASLWRTVEEVLSRARSASRKPIPASRFMRLVIERTILARWISPMGMIEIPEGYKEESS